MNANETYDQMLDRNCPNGISGIPERVTPASTHFVSGTQDEKKNGAIVGERSGNLFQGSREECEEFLKRNRGTFRGRPVIKVVK